MTKLLLKVLKQATDCSTKDGCDVKRMFYPSSRYKVDFAKDFNSEGWKQFDTNQDAPYFGVWVNPKQFFSLTYCEGDWTLVECHNRERYNREMRCLCDCYSDGVIATVYGDGQKTVIKQDRSEFILD